MIRSPYFFVVAFVGILAALRVEGDRRLKFADTARSIPVIQMAERGPASLNETDPAVEVLLDALESDLSGNFEEEGQPQYSTEPELPLQIEELSVSDASSE